MMNAFLAGILVLAQAIPNVCTPPAPKHVLLFVGQSNMVGDVKPKAADMIPDPRLWEMDTDNHLSYVAADPIQKNGGVSPGLAFGKKYADHHPDTLPVLIGAAVSGTAISAWIAPNSSQYRDALNTVRVAQAEEGTLVAILWEQGEADAKTVDLANAYEGKLRTLVARFRADFGPDVPIVLSEIPHSDAGGVYPFWPTVNAAIANVVATTPNIGLSLSTGLPQQPKEIHYTAAGAREMGERMESVLAGMN